MHTKKRWPHRKFFYLPHRSLQKVPWRMKWQPSSVLLPRKKSHEQKSLVGYSPWSLRVYHMTEQMSMQPVPEQNISVPGVSSQNFATQGKRSLWNADILVTVMDFSEPLY